MAMATTLLTSPQFGEPGRDRPTIGRQGIGGALSLFARRYHEECRKVNTKVCILRQRLNLDPDLPCDEPVNRHGHAG